jgi:hypothetical protein
MMARASADGKRRRCGMATWAIGGMTETARARGGRVAGPTARVPGRRTRRRGERTSDHQRPVRRNGVTNTCPWPTESSRQEPPCASGGKLCEPWRGHEPGADRLDAGSHGPSAAVRPTSVALPVASPILWLPPWPLGSAASPDVRSLCRTRADRWAQTSAVPSASCARKPRLGLSAPMRLRPCRPAAGRLERDFREQTSAAQGPLGAEPRRRRSTHPLESRRAPSPA